ncbi:MAG: hypothetical protein SO125_02985 [Eubacteriales bacterium]|nr:hypothetical protein [Eubacteriales bacterium]
MKKLLSIILFFAATILIFSACSASKKDQSGYLPYTAYISANGTEGVGSVVDAARRYTWPTDEDIPAPKDNTISVTALGTTYNADYFGKKAQTFGRPEYIYKTEAGDQLSIDDSGTVLSLQTARSFGYYSEDPHDTNVKSKIKSPEEYLEIATQFVEEIYGTDIASRFSGSLPTIASTKIWVFFSLSANQVSAYQLKESIAVVISAEGEFLSVFSNNINAFENKSVPADFTDERIIQIISNSLVNKDAQIELSELKNLVILGDGRLACYTSFKIANGNNESEWTSVVIPLE